MESHHYRVKGRNLLPNESSKGSFFFFFSFHPFLFPVLLFSLHCVPLLRSFLFFFSFSFSFLHNPHPRLLPSSVRPRWHTRSHRRPTCVPSDKHHLQDQASDHPIHSNNSRGTRGSQDSHTRDNNNNQEHSRSHPDLLLLIQVNSR